MSKRRAPSSGRGLYTLGSRPSKGEMSEDKELLLNTLDTCILVLREGRDRVLTGDEEAGWDALIRVGVGCRRFAELAEEAEGVRPSREEVGECAGEDAVDRAIGFVKGLWRGIDRPLR